jgi:hypothetical protein
MKLSFDKLCQFRRGVLQCEVGLVEEGGHQRLAVLDVKAVGVHDRLLGQGPESALQDLGQTRKLSCPEK